jgi:hypothetical protein
MGDFYAAFSSTCFVVLTLWLMTVQQRYKDWDNHRRMIQRAFGIGLHFSLPGIMALISMVDPAAPRLWEWSYTLVALGGTAVLAVLYTAARDRLTAVAYPVAMALYLAIGAFAIVGLTRPQAHLENQIDQVLLCMMLFLGLNVGWFLLFGPGDRTGASVREARDPGGGWPGRPGRRVGPAGQARLGRRVRASSIRSCGSS